MSRGRQTMVVDSAPSRTAAVEGGETKGTVTTTPQTLRDDVKSYSIATTVERMT